MIKEGEWMRYDAIMLDLDQTLLDTSALKKWRNVRAWEECDKHLHLTRLFPYVKAFLESITGKKIAIVTNSPHDYAMGLLEYHKINYDLLTAYQKSGRNKPYPDQLLNTAEKLGVNPDRCIYIGDDPNDVVAAKIAGYHSVGFCYENQGIEVFITYMPDGIVSDFLQLMTYVQKLDDSSFQQRMNYLYEEALQAKYANNGQKYIDKLKEVSQLGHGQAQYKLSKLLKKYPYLAEENRDADYYMWEAVKQMTPEAIYEVGYQYEKEGKTEVAEHFFRTASRFGVPHAQFHLGRLKLTKAGFLEKAAISHRWIKKSVVNGFSHAEELLAKVTRILAFETELKERMFFDHGSAVFYLDSYIPEKRYDDVFSRLILKVKDKDQSAIIYFFKQFKGFPMKGMALCYVPSSDMDNIDTGIRRIAQGLSHSQAVDATDCLFRYQSKEKSSQGGERSIDIHLNTMMVRNLEKIKGKHILLLDDITTSGSALVASEKLLLEAGALHVTKLALGKTK